MLSDNNVMPDYLSEWYYMEPDWRGSSFVRGPFTLEDMHNLIRGGSINGKTQVRCGLNSHWHPLKEVSAIFASATPLNKRRTEFVRSGQSKNRKVVVLVIIGVIAIFVSLVERGRRPPGVRISGAGPPPIQEPLSKEAIIGLTNNARTLQGLIMLSENPLLDGIAEARVKDMLEKQYFAHVSPTGEQASDIAQRVGYRYKIIAENIASGLFFTNQKIIDGWMQSPGHRKNILSPEVREMGASVIKGRMNGADTWVSVQIFGLQSLPVSEKSCMPPSQELLGEIETKKTEIGTLNERLTRLRQELDAEKDSIELERRLAGNDPKRNYDLNGKIRAYNEKSNWHNQSLAEMNAKETVLNSMAEEYNKALQSYRDCKASD